MENCPKLSFNYDQISSLSVPLVFPSYHTFCFKKRYDLIYQIFSTDSWYFWQSSKKFCDNPSYHWFLFPPIMLYQFPHDIAENATADRKTVFKPEKSLQCIVGTQCLKVELNFRFQWALNETKFLDGLRLFFLQMFKQFDLIIYIFVNIMISTTPLPCNLSFLYFS